MHLPPVLPRLWAAPFLSFLVSIKTGIEYGDHFGAQTPRSMGFPWKISGNCFLTAHFSSKPPEENREEGTVLRSSAFDQRNDSQGKNSVKIILRSPIFSPFFILDNIFNFILGSHLYARGHIKGKMAQWCFPQKRQAQEFGFISGETSDPIGKEVNGRYPRRNSE